MRPSQITQAIIACAVMNRPLFIWGPPGVGKSDTVRQASTALSGRYGLLFMDEMNSAPPQTQAACYQIVLDRRVGDYEMPDGWRIVAAGNRSNDRGVVHRMPDPLVDRFFHVDYDVSMDDWCQWALHGNASAGSTAALPGNMVDFRAALRDAVDIMGLPGAVDGQTFYNKPAGLPREPVEGAAAAAAGAAIRPEVVAFIRFRSGLLHNHDTKRECHAFSTPRGWADVSLVLDTAEAATVEAELIRGRVGDGAASEFMAFLKLYRNMVSPDAVLAAPLKAEVPQNVGTLYALAEALARRATVANIDRVLAYARRMPSEYAQALVSSMTRITPALCNTHEFIKWASERG